MYQRSGLQIKYLPAPSPHIQGSCGQYPRHELEAARRSLIIQTHRSSPVWQRIKQKLGILPDNRRFVYVSQNNPRAGKMGNDPWTSDTGSVHNGLQSRSGDASGANCDVTAGEKRKHEATRSDCEQPQTRKMKVAGDNKLNPETFSESQKKIISSGPSGDAPGSKMGALSGGKRYCPTSESDSEQHQTQKMKNEGNSGLTKPTKLGIFFKCDFCTFASTSSGKMSQHLEDSDHLTASEFHGELEAQFKALQLLRPMVLTCRCKDFGSRVPVCSMCGLRFDNIFSCLGHLVVSHKMQNLTYHVRQVEKTSTEVIDVDGARPVCKVCQTRTDSLSELGSHCLSRGHFLSNLQQSGSDVYFACKMESCQKVFSYISQLMNHLKQHRPGVTGYSFVWAHLGEISELTLLDADVDSGSRVNLESVLCSHLGIFYEKSSCTGKDRKHKRKNLEKYQDLLKEKKRDLEAQKRKDSKSF